LSSIYKNIAVKIVLKYVIRLFFLQSIRINSKLARHIAINIICINSANYKYHSRSTLRKIDRRPFH